MIAKSSMEISWKSVIFYEVDGEKSIVRKLEKCMKTVEEKLKEKL
jgi:ribosomal protein S27AE